jgi:hypothetical protein
MTVRVRRGECWCLPQTDGDGRKQTVTIRLRSHMGPIWRDGVFGAGVGVCSPEDDVRMVTVSPSTLT